MTDRVHLPPIALPVVERDRIVEALNDTADRAGRAATAAAGELERAKAAGDVTDERPVAVKIARKLAEAATLRRFATMLDELAPATAHPDGPADPPADDDRTDDTVGPQEDLDP